MALKLANDNEKNESVDRVQGNPWEYDDMTIKETSIRASYNNEIYTSNVSKSKSDTNVIILIGRIVVYIVAILSVVGIIWCATQDKVDIAFNVTKLQWLFSLLSLVCIIDSILVNVLYERKISLIIFALLLQFLYPLKRDQHVNGSGGIGALVSLGMVISYVALFATLFSAFSTYNAIVSIEDDQTRKVAAEVFDQSATQGTNLGTRITNNVAVTNVQVVTQGTKQIVVFEGMGRHNISDEGVMVESGNMIYDTKLAFAKNESGKYVLTGVALNNKQLNAQFVSYYNSMILIP